MDTDSNAIEEIKNRLDIVQIVEKYVTLKQAGKNFSGLCPFHHEKTPSFIVSPDIQRYKCFGCGETGDIFNFVQKIENLDFPETLNKLAKEAGVELKQYKKNPTYEKLEDINYLATKYYYNQLKQDQRATEYIKKRGFTQESIKRFGVGYAPKYPKLLDYIQKYKKYSNNELVTSGLFVQKDGKVKEKFYDRIMFPIRSSKGVVIGFSGRILPGNDYGPKYMNSPETAVFHKKDNLFGQYESRQEIRKLDLAILCEGQTDVISSHQNNIKNIVAPLGTGLTKDQLESLSRLTKNILFFFDSDNAGQNAVIRAFKIASQLNLYPYANNSSPYKDIDELLQKEPERLSKLIKDKQEAFSYILVHFLKDKNLTKMQDIISTQNFVNDLLASVPNQTLKQHYVSRAKHLTRLDFDSKESYAAVHKATIKNVKTNIQPNLLDKTYLQLLILTKNVSAGYLVPSRYISDKQLRLIYLKIKHSAGKDPKTILASFEENQEQKLLVENLILEATDMEENPEKQLQLLAKRLRHNYLVRRQKELSAKMAQAEEVHDRKQIESLSNSMLKIAKLLRSTEND